MGLIDVIENSLLEDREETRVDGKAGPTDAAIATCMGIMGRVSPFDLLDSRLKWAAFGEDTGGVSLVARSLATNRRVDFVISPDGLSVSAICVDEHPKTKSMPLDGVHLCLDGITQWLNDSWRIGCEPPGGSVAPPEPLESP